VIGYAKPNHETHEQDTKQEELLTINRIINLLKNIIPSLDLAEQFVIDLT
jgi:hypothetical protein